CGPLWARPERLTGLMSGRKHDRVMRALGFLGAIAAYAVASCSGTGATSRGFNNAGGDNGSLINAGAGGDSTTTGGATSGAGTSMINPTNPNDGDGGGCNDLHVKYEKLVPTVLLLVDESGSMYENKYPTGGADSRWAVLRNAIVVDPASFLNTLQ